MKITYYGHSCFMLEENIKILTDPFISNNPLATIDLYRLKPDVILLTHDHSDHMGDTIEIAENSGAIVITLFDIALKLNKFNVATLGGNLGGTIEYKDCKFTFVRADHSSITGRPVGFVIDCGSKKIYFAGDTNVFYDMKIIHDLYNPEIAMLPIDGYFNMGPREAVYALKLLKVLKVIPMHYGTFPLLKGTPEDLKKEIEKNELETQMIVFEINETKEF